MIEINGDAAAEQARQAAERARLLADRFRNAYPVFRQVSVMLDRWVMLNFKGQGKNVGGWAPFKYGGRVAPKKPGSRRGVYAKRGGKAPPAANAAKIVGPRNVWINTNAMLLQDTGSLRMSTLPFASATEAGIGSYLPYSKNHNEGIGVPQRRILPNESEVGPQATAIFERWMQAEMRRVFA